MENRAGAGQAYYPSSYPPGYYQSFAVEQVPASSEAQRGFSWLVPCFVVANVAVFIATMYVNNCPDGSTVCIMGALGRLSFQPLSENPLFGPSSATLEKMGALNSTKVMADHEGWRLISCIWLHAGVIHLLANMLSLCFIGIRLEQEFCFWRIGIIYLTSGFGGSLLSVLFLQNRISVGASGALFGLLGAMLSELFTNWPTYTGKCGALTTLIFVIALNLAIGMLPHVDNFAHIGGFVSGFLLGFVLLLRANAATATTRFNHKPYQYVLLVLALVLLITGYAVAISMVFRGIDGNKHCSWCHYLSCVSTSRWSCHNSGPYLCQYTLEMNGTIYVTCQSNNVTQSFLRSTNLSNPGLNQLCNQICS